MRRFLFLFLPPKFWALADQTRRRHVCRVWLWVRFGRWTWEVCQNCNEPIHLRKLILWSCQKWPLKKRKQKKTPLAMIWYSAHSVTFSTLKKVGINSLATLLKIEGWNLAWDSLWSIKCWKNPSDIYECEVKFANRARHFLKEYILLRKSVIHSRKSE